MAGVETLTLDELRRLEPQAFEDAGIVNVAEPQHLNQR
jgi:hypothetical protein